MGIHPSGMRASARRFFHLHPLFVMALAVVACVVCMRHGWLSFTLAVAVVVALGGWIAGWRPALAWGMCGVVGALVFHVRIHSQESAEHRLVGLTGKEISAEILKDARGGESFWSAPAVIRSGPESGVRIWWQGRGPVPVAGARVKAQGDFEPLPAARNPGEFDRAAWLRSQGISAVFLPGKQKTRVETGLLAEFGARIRMGFRERVTAGLPEDSREAQVIRAVVIGEAPPDADALISAFRNSGTLHAFSVSGLHVAMVASIGWFLLARLGLSRRRAVWVLLPLVFGYSWLTGNSAPAVRSAWMAAVFLGAFSFRRRPDLLNALGAVLLAALLWDARMLFLPGVQLSYGVVAAIAIGTSWAAKWFQWLETPELYLPASGMYPWQARWLHFRKKLSQSLAVSVAAAIGSAPLTAFHFGLVTPVSILAGLVLVPLVFLMLAGALLAVLLSPLAPVARCINRINGSVANLSVMAAEGFSAIPGGHWQIGADTRPGLWVYDLEHGAGASVFSGGDGAVLMDCADESGFKQRLLPSLRRLGLSPDAVVLSHADGSHLGGELPVWKSLPVERVLLPVGRARSPAFRGWLEDAPRAGVKVFHAAEGSMMPFPDDARLEVLLVPDAGGQQSLADDRVALYRLHWRGWKFLFTSDAGMKTETKALESGKDLSADVIIAGCHRSDISLGDAFLDAVRPRVIVVSNSAYPPAERRNPESLAYWRSRGILVMDQAEAGGVTFRMDGQGGLVLHGFLENHSVTLNHR